MDQLGALLARDGRLVVYVPAHRFLFSAMDVKVGHVQRYRRKQLEDIMRNAGLEIVHSSYCDPLGFFATLVYKWFGRRDGSINDTALRIYDRMVFPLSRLTQVLTGRLFGKNVLVVASRRA